GSVILSSILEDRFLEVQGVEDLRGGVLASINVRPTFIEEIKANQFKDESLNELRKKTVYGKAQDVALDEGGVLSFKERMYVP
ncbi:hypothetical protein MTR67_047938, partial [Solanum verrucosum]